MTTTKQFYNPEAIYKFKAFDVEYLRHGTTPLLARIYQPDGEGPFPAILDIHGGAWTTGDRFQNTLIDEMMAETGLVVVALDFRVSPAHPYPAQIQDTNFGARWAKAHVAEYNALPSPLGAMCTSSGGHTMLCSAMKPKDPQYAAIPFPEHPELDAGIDYYLGLWSVLDPLRRYHYQKEDGHVMHLVRNSDAYFGSEEKMAEGNPQMMLDRGDFTHLPPALIVEPYPDEFIPEDVPIKFTETYNAKGGKAERVRIENSEHGFARIDSDETQQAFTAMRKFIADQLAPVSF